MKNGVEFVFKNKKLNQILKAFSSDIPSVKIGVLGSKDARNDGKSTNAEIGIAHEFGTTKLPKRSFLRTPIRDNLEKYLEKSGAFDDKVLMEVVKTSNLKPWITKVGLVGETVVQEGFMTGGFGKWVPSVMDHKKVHMTLVETQQLRNSIGSEVI